MLRSLRFAVDISLLTPSGLFGLVILILQ
jgi:hypothetical protein